MIDRRGWLSIMTWNWQTPEWPHFEFDSSRLAALEEQFRLGAGVAIGAAKHLGQQDYHRLQVEVMTGEAVTTSAIEGQVLNRDSVRSSILRQLGMVSSDQRRVSAKEQGISEMMVDLCRSFPQPLTEGMLFGWHCMVTAGRSDIVDRGRYRTSKKPMQIVSGPIGDQTVHFAAPAAKRLPAEMKRFLSWFAHTASPHKQSLPAVTRAGIAHLYFESIHPFEDGNGRIGRAIAEKAIAQSLGQPVLISLATTILAHQKDYYRALERASRTMKVTEWLVWFAQILLEAQGQSLAQVEFIIAKTKLLDRLRGQINPRQQKALLRMFREGPEGFKGGLSASNYSTITGAPSATTTRDLQDLTEKGALVRTGERRHARYALNLT
jgi:Fic family protein